MSGRGDEACMTANGEVAGPRELGIEGQWASYLISLTTLVEISATRVCPNASREPHKGVTRVCVLL